MEEHQKFVILFLVILFFAFLFFYYFNERYYSIEKFSCSSGKVDRLSDRDALIPLDLGETSLDYYKDTWTNSFIIANNVDDPTRKNRLQNGQIINKQNSELVLWKNLPGNPSNKQFSVSFWIYINHTTWPHWPHLFVVNTDHYWGGRGPGIYLWPMGPALHIRQTIPNNYNAGEGDFIKKGNKWEKGELNKTNIGFKRTVFCTVVFDEKNYFYYANGELVYQNTLEKTPLKSKGNDYIQVGVDTQKIYQPNKRQDPHCLVMKDVQIFPRPLTSCQVKMLYDKNSENGNIHDALDAIRNMESFQNMTVKSNFESFTSTMNNNDQSQITTQTGEAFDFLKYTPSEVTDDSSELEQIMADNIGSGEPNTNADGITSDSVRKVVELDSTIYNLEQTKTLTYYDFDQSKNLSISLHKKAEQGDRILFTGSSLTISFWIKSPRNHSLQEWTWNNMVKNIQNVFCFQYINGWIALSIGMTDLWCHMWDGNRYYSTGIRAITNNEWNHITWVMSNENDKPWTFYVNGIFEKTVRNKEFPKINVQNGNPVGEQCIGKFIGSVGKHYFKGCLGDLRVYPFAMTEDQVIDKGGFAKKNTKKEVFQIKGYKHEKSEAEEKCKEYGADVASKAQVERAQRNNANWCSTGWVSDLNHAVYPITTQTIHDANWCGGPTAGLRIYTPPSEKAAVNCYGEKPKQTEDMKKVLHNWNETQWSKYD